MKITKLGVWIGFGDFILSIIIPLIIYSLVGENLRNIFIYPEITYELIVVLVCTFFLFFIFAEPLCEKFSTLFLAVFKRLPNLNRKLFLLFAIGYLFASLVYFFSGYNFNRYDRIAASENLYRTFWVEIIFFCKAIVSALVFYTLVLKYYYPDKSKLFFGRYYWSIILLSLLLTIDGMAQIMLIGVVLLMLVRARGFIALIHQTLFKNLKYKLLGLVILTGLFILGIAFKEKGFTNITTPAEYYFAKLLWLIDRLSTIYFSTGFVINSHIHNSDINQTAWQIVSNEINFRLCSLFQTTNCSSFKDGYGSISRFNFGNILVNDPGRGGASPGVLGSAAYLFPLSLVPFIAILYYSMIAAVVQVAIGKQRKFLTVTGIIIYGYLLRGLYLNPAAMINPLSSPMIAMVVFVIVSLYFYQGRTSLNEK